ncbi:unnamed protein product [Xylocopa violacea]|uniref:Condensin-2 complex subunit H2 C-terminal domain-containing protein n=2 Tax=Xylocopa violacea TaxID=135666 RepID=A0ABP1P911_XYLVO
MVTLQDISVQLMKPAKDLADWKFPLSQILEEYYALLEEPCDINFGEAALVLQNSTNVYVRRIECLLNETEILRQTFFGYEENEKKSVSKEKNIFKKNYIDFENFVIIDIEKDIGKHIDKKNQYQAQKKVKLLSHRFTQLENGIIQLYVPIQMYDVSGEVIGKKYDFRCNQAINITGLLVDELTPYDFTCLLNSRLHKGRNSLSLYSEPKTPGTGTSGYHSLTLPNDDDSIMHDTFVDEDNSSQMGNNSLANELVVVEKENVLNNNTNRGSLIKNDILSESITKKSILEKQHTEQNAVQNICNQNSSIQNSKEITETKKDYQNKDLAQMNQLKEDNQNNDKRAIEFEISDQITHYKQLDHSTKEEQIIQQYDSDNVRCKENLSAMRKRGNPTMKLSVCSVDDINECDWKPMPLIQGIKQVFSHNSSILKLPNYISFLGTKFGSKKRKFRSKLRKPECLTKLALRENELCTKKDVMLQTKQKFRHLQKQELKDFMKNFDQCFNGVETENDNSRYEVVTNIAIDVLGFRVTHDQDNTIENSIEETMSRSSSFTDMLQNSPDTTAKFPDSCNNWCEFGSSSEINLSYSLPDYQTLIEDKMKEIFKESNVTTELDQTVAKWHASLQSKLIEAEIRPAFRIHDYMSRIIGVLQALEEKKVNFDSVVHDKPACEVARYFLASLQLANTYNVEIKTENYDNSIQITLLNDKDDRIRG